MDEHGINSEFFIALYTFVTFDIILGHEWWGNPSLII